jgi:hypothetical protein
VTYRRLKRDPIPRGPGNSFLAMISMIDWRIVGYEGTGFLRMLGMLTGRRAV